MRRFFTMIFHMLTAVFHKDSPPVKVPPDQEAYKIQEVRRLRKWEENLRKREASHAKKVKEIQKHRQQQESRLRIRF